MTINCRSIRLLDLVSPPKPLKIVASSHFVEGSRCRRKRSEKLSRPTLPMQRQLNLQQEGRCFDLQEIFERVNARYFRGRLRGYKVVWGRRRKKRPKEYFIFGTIQEEDRVIRIHPLLDQPFVPSGFWNTSFITRCCTRWCPTKPNQRDVAGCTPRNSIAAKKNFRVTVGLGAGKNDNLARSSLAVRLAEPLPLDRRASELRRQGGRRYVLFDEVPERGREQEGDQFRAPVVQDQSSS